MEEKNSKQLKKLKQTYSHFDWEYILKL